VARRLKTPTPKRKARVAGDYVRPKKVNTHAILRGEDSDSDEGAAVPEGPPMIRRSTRRAAAVCRENTAHLMRDEITAGDMMSPNGHPGAASSRPMDEHFGNEYARKKNDRNETFTPNPMLVSVTVNNGYSVEDLFGRTAPRPTADEDIMRNPTAGGRNLCRVESIECMFNNDNTTGSIDRALGLTRNTSSSQLILAQCPSELGRGIHMERANSTSNLALTRCMSSTLSLFSVGEEDLMSTMEDSSENSMHGVPPSLADSGDTLAPNELIINA